MRRVFLVGLLLLGLALVALPACDSDSSGGGAATSGYSLTDLAGTWAWHWMLGGWQFSGTVVIDSEGIVRHAGLGNCSIAGGVWINGYKFTVFSDGRVWAKGWSMCPLGANTYKRLNGQFQSAAYIVGTIATYDQPNGTLLNKGSFRMEKH